MLLVCKGQGRGYMLGEREGNKVRHREGWRPANAGRLDRRYKAHSGVLRLYGAVRTRRRHAVGTGGTCYTLIVRRRHGGVPRAEEWRRPKLKV